CSVIMSATCGLRASGKLWFTRSDTCSCCWEASRTVRRPLCVSLLVWECGPRLPSYPSEDPSGDSGLWSE
ncbi:hypothetical protein GOODEAATRI_008037, partial [Goodea atripinnis]